MATGVVRDGTGRRDWCVEGTERMTAVSAVIILALVMALLLGDLLPVGRAASRTPFVKVPAINGWESVWCGIVRRDV
jgi:hypothetical protein